MKKTIFQKLTTLFVLFLLISASTFAQKYVLPELPKGKFGPVFDANTKSSASVSPSFVFGDATDISDRAYAVFLTSDPSSVLPLFTTFPFAGIFGSAGEMVWGDPYKFYSIDVDLFGVGGNYDAWLIDPDVPSVTPLGAITGVTGLGIWGMALDHRTGVYYICDDDDNLYTVDMTTLVATLVGNFATGSGSMTALTFDGHGNLFGFDTEVSEIVRIDKTTAAIYDEHIAYVIYADPIPLHGMGWDPVTGKIVLTILGDDVEYRSVDTVLHNTNIIGVMPTIFPSVSIASPVCEGMPVYLRDSEGILQAGGSLEYREGGGSGWQAATEISDGVFCIDTDRSQVGLRMTYSPQVLKVTKIPTNIGYTFNMERVHVELVDGGIPVDGGEVHYTSNGFFPFGSGYTGDDGSGSVEMDMLPNTYTFRMKYLGDKDLKTETISAANRYIAFDIADLKSTLVDDGENLSLVAYPNPFSGNTTIAFSLKEAQEVNISVYDQTGRLIEVLQDGNLTEGNHKIIWDASDVQDGLYIFRLSTETSSYTKRLSKN